MPILKPSFYLRYPLVSKLLRIYVSFFTKHKKRKQVTSMVLTDDELSKYTKAIRWAQIPTNRKSLDPEFEALLQFIELKLDTLKPKQRTHLHDH